MSNDPKDTALPTGSGRPTPPPLGATVLGYPRIGRDRELKSALEGYWSGRLDLADLNLTGVALRREAAVTMQSAGLGSVPVGTFSFYDQMLDMSHVLGVIPQRYRAETSGEALYGFDAGSYFAMARGTAELAPSEMTKWFDTNYHYLVPEVGPDTRFTLDTRALCSEFSEAQQLLGVRVPRPVIIGPVTYLSLAKPAEDAPEEFTPLDRLEELVGIYGQLLEDLAERGIEWVQIDEPALVRTLDDRLVARVRTAYDRLSAVRHRPAILVATYFANPVEALPVLAASGIEGIALDLTQGITPEEVRDLPGIAEKTLVLGIVDGRNIWRTDLTAARDRLEAWRGIGREVAVSTSCSLLHVPYDVSRETGLDPALRDSLAFADQKLAEVVALQHAWDHDYARCGAAFAASAEALAQRPAIPGLLDAAVADRVAQVAETDRRRQPREVRDDAQTANLGLPLLPTTTIGSFPQTPALRSARAAHRAGRLSLDDYEETMRREVAEVVALQESLGLDVLVHGEPERNDMVQYFAEQLDGYAASAHGWVQSYGSRCVRPPILYGDVHRRAPMTVGWATYAQSLTTRPVKGMLTGPVTMLAWSFVRTDQPRSVTADQVALALRDEVADLERAGIGIIQVDEPALRETLPLRVDAQKQYLDWAVAAFRLATSGVRAHTQIHTHLCYSEFGEIIGAIDSLDADVTSIEAARSRMELLGDVRRFGFRGGLGPGVYDIHAPRVPSADEIVGLLSAALASVPAQRLWVNPDCGLKTRGYDEVTASLRHLVAAAAQVRAELAAQASV